MQANAMLDQETQRSLGENTGAVVLNSSPINTYHIVCTLAEGRYFYGLAALANSLVQAGFKGSIVVGYRGHIPAWLEALEMDATRNAYLVTRDVLLHFVAIPGTWHLANYKGHFIRDLFHRIAPTADLVYFFDTDIVISHAWSTLAEWARNGVVVALDMADTYMSPHHVYRRAWRALAADISDKSREFTGYVNSGCVGIHREFAEFAETWALLMEALERDGADMGKMKNWAGKREFARMDQDALNATIMATDTPIALLGSEAMGWFPGTGEVMSHAMLHKKPWMRRYILDALRGFPPDRAHRTYWKFVEGPIRPFCKYELTRRKAALKIARLVGFFHCRSFRDL